jgi:hypothetical protein
MAMHSLEREVSYSYLFLAFPFNDHGRKRFPSFSPPSEHSCRKIYYQ